MFLDFHVTSMLTRQMIGHVPLAICRCRKGGLPVDPGAIPWRRKDLQSTGNLVHGTHKDEGNLGS